MNNDEQVKKEDHFEEDEEDAKGVQEHCRGLTIRDLYLLVPVSALKPEPLLTVQSFPGLLPRPAVGVQYGIEVGLGNGRVAIHYFLDQPPDARKRNPAIEES
jgi:hypothetical protein